MKKIFIIISAVILLLLAGYILGMVHEREKSPVRLAFLGDSITEYGWSEDYGYVKQTIKGLKDKGIKVVPIPAGICGNKSYDMLIRMDKDVIDYYPDIMVFMGGINDVIYQREEFNQYKENIKQIIAKAKANDIKVILLNLTVMTNDINSEDNKVIDKYNEFLAEFAKEENITLLDINSAFKDEINNTQNPQDYILTTDGLHLNEKGNKIISDKLIDTIIKLK